MDKTQLNSHFQTLEIDYLYHLGLDSGMDLASQFGDVKYVLFTRSFANADHFANQFTKAIYQIKDVNITCQTIAKDERYHIYKIANTIIISHGVGFPSMLICLNEVVKLLWHAGATDFQFIRLGPAGGVQAPAGSVVIASEAVDPTLNSHWKNIEFGEYYSYPSLMDAQLAANIIAANPTKTLISGKVMSGYSFYNGQARLNGALPVWYTATERDSYLVKVAEAGVRAIDLESSCFAAFCQYFQIPAAAVLPILTDRLHDNDLEPELHAQNHSLIDTLINAGEVVINYILANTFTKV